MKTAFKAVAIVTSVLSFALLVFFSWPIEIYQPKSATNFLLVSEDDNGKTYLLGMVKIRAFENRHEQIAAFPTDRVVEPIPELGDEGFWTYEEGPDQPKLHVRVRNLEISSSPSHSKNDHSAGKLAQSKEKLVAAIRKNLLQEDERGIREMVKTVKCPRWKYQFGKYEADFRKWRRSFK